MLFPTSVYLQEVTMKQINKHILLLSMLLACISPLMSQSPNLVPNPSFEDYNDFGNGAVEPKLWDLTLGTPDYFSSKFKFPFENTKTPFNYYGYQIPKAGIAYMGFAIKNIYSPEKREYVQIKLKNHLTKDSLYTISFWINLPDSFHWACEQQNIAFAFSDTLVKSNFEVLDRLPSIFFSDSIWDPTNKTGWEKITAKVKALGNENYLIIGNFNNSNSTALQNVGGGTKPVYKEQSYYFIDNVELYLNSVIDTLSPSDTTKENFIIPTIFTPNADGVNDIWRIYNDNFVQEVFIYNRWGNIIHSWKGPGGAWDGRNTAEGVYFYKVVFLNSGTARVKHGSITLLR